jgi:glycyl-tRNA synthetase
MTDSHNLKQSTSMSTEKYPENTMEKIISLAKRRGFVFQGSEIYGGLAGTWDYGPLGVALKQNIQNLWWKKFVLDREDMYGVDAAILMNQEVWKASGHVAGFSDPLVEDLKTKKRFRADHLLEEVGVDPRGMTIEQMDALIKEKGIKSPDGNPLGEVRQFNMMFKTNVGATQDESSVSYLRPETAQGIFVNFKNVVDSFHPKLPFGIAQIGKAFRNEIAPRAPSIVQSCPLTPSPGPLLAPMPPPALCLTAGGSAWLGSTWPLLAGLCLRIQYGTAHSFPMRHHLV